MSDIGFLVVDPSKAIQTFMRQTLVGYGFQAGSIKTASTPQEAQTLVAHDHIDFLLSDWFDGAPLSGIGLYQHLRESSHDCRFALLSVKVDPARQKEASDAGSLFLLGKPFTADQLRAELIRTLEKLAKTHLKLVHHVNASAPQPASTRARHVPDAPLPHFKPGDVVRYKDRRETVAYIILRHGELVVQLKGIPGLIDSHKIQPL